MIKFKLKISNNNKLMKIKSKAVKNKKKQKYLKRVLKNKAKKSKANLNHHHTRHLLFLVK